MLWYCLVMDVIQEQTPDNSESHFWRNVAIGGATVALALSAVIASAHGLPPLPLPPIHIEPIHNPDFGMFDHAANIGHTVLGNVNQ